MTDLPRTFTSVCYIYKSRLPRGDKLRRLYIEMESDKAKSVVGSACLAEMERLRTTTDMPLALEMKMERIEPQGYHDYFIIKWTGTIDVDKTWLVSTEDEYSESTAFAIGVSDGTQRNYDNPYNLDTREFLEYEAGYGVGEGKAA